MESLYDRISDGTLSVDEITASMERSTSTGGKYFQSMEKQSKTLNGQVSTLKDNFGQFAGVLAQDTTNAISNEFLPAINDTIQAMQEGFREDGFEGMAEAFAEGFTNILMMLVEKAPEVVNVAMTIIQSFVNSIQENLPMIINSAIQIVSTLAQGILDMLPQILEMGIQIIVQLIQGIAQQAPTLIPQIVDCLLLMVDTIINNLDLLIDAGIELIVALIEGIFNALPNLIAKLPELIIKLSSKLIELIWSDLPKAGQKIIDAIIDGLLGYYSKMIQKIKEMFKGTIFEPLVNSVADMAEVGLNLIKGLWNGIKSAKDWIMKKIKGFGKSVLNGFKSVFGIKSPSRLFRDEIGKQLSAGIGVGFEDELSNVYRDMQKAIDSENTKLNATVQTGAVYNKVMNTTPVNVNGTYTSKLEVNGEVLATVVNDVNDKKDLQYMF